MHIKISVIIPIYNAEKYLHQCLKSICSQTLQDIEIICVDDGSTDNSLKILQEFEKNDKRIIILKQKNAGAGAARNTGLKVAKGEYLSFLDADDFFEPSMLETMYNSAKKFNTDITLCRSDKYLDHISLFEDSPLTLNASILPKEESFLISEIEKNIFKSMMGWTWDKLYKASFIKDLHLTFQEQRTTNDMFFVFAALASAKNVSVCNDVLVHYRKVSKGSLSVSREKSWHCFYDALIALKSYLIEHNLYELYRVDFINYALHFSLWNLKTLTYPVQKYLYDKLKLEWFLSLEIPSLEVYDVYYLGEYKEFKKILASSYEDYYNDITKKRSIINGIKVLYYFYNENGLCITLIKIKCEIQKHIKTFLKKAINN